jgi:hypothetical protein
LSNFSSPREWSAGNLPMTRPLPKVWPSKSAWLSPLRQLNLRDTPVRLHGYNYNLSFCYPRRMADSNRNGMLFSSGDSPNSFSDPFGGWAR